MKSVLATLGLLLISCGLIVIASTIVAAAEPPSQVSQLEITLPAELYNRTSRFKVSWNCQPGFKSARIVNEDINGIELQDTGWHDVPDTGNCTSPDEIGNEVEFPDEWLVKGLYPGQYKVSLSLKNEDGIELTAQKSIELVHNLDLSFGGQRGGNWRRVRGDWGLLNGYSFGARGNTIGVKALTYFEGDIYKDRPGPDFDEHHEYSFQAALRLNCDSRCTAGLALAVDEEASGPGYNHFRHVDFLFSPDNKLSVEYVLEFANGKGPITKRLALIDVSKYADVRGFFNFRVEFEARYGSMVIFINDNKVHCGRLNNNIYNGWSGAVGLVYRGARADHYFEVSALKVRPSVWETRGKFCKYPVE